MKEKLIAALIYVNSEKKEYVQAWKLPLSY